jgi:hypothetical protein
VSSGTTKPNEASIRLGILVSSSIALSLESDFTVVQLAAILRTRTISFVSCCYVSLLYVFYRVFMYKGMKAKERLPECAVHENNKKQLGGLRAAVARP